MNGGTQSEVSEARSLRHLLSALVDDTLIIDAVTAEDSARLALVLVTSLVLVVPVLVLWVGVPLLLILPIVGIVYVAYCYWTGRVMTCLISSFFVLSVFGADIPLFDGPDKADLSVFIVDLLAVALLVAILYQRDLDIRQVLSSKLSLAAVSGLAAFVVWSFVAAAIGNGPSRAAATIFAVQQMRYLVMFLAALLVVSHTQLVVALYPLLISIGGNVLYGLAEVVAGHTFGLTYLGDAGGQSFTEFGIGPWVFETGFFVSGYVGHVRELVALTLLLLPFLVYVGTSGRLRKTVVALLSLGAAAIVVRAGGTDAGLGASILALTATGVLLLGVYSMDRLYSQLRSALLSVLAIVSSVGLYRGWFSVGGADSGGDGLQEGPNPTTPGPQGGTGDPTTVIADILSAVPVVEINTLSIRLTQYAAAIDIAISYPVFGIGGYNFALLSQEYSLPAKVDIHNQYLAYLAATGLPGLMAYLVSVGSVFALLCYSVLRGEEQYKLLYACLLCSLLAFHAYSFWVASQKFVMPNIAFWMLSGMIVGSVWHTSGDGRA